jgi:hypothetical protein
VIHGWIGVDFDGTLAHSETGDPIMPMVDRVRAWLAASREVRIVTARAANPDRQLYLPEVDEFCLRQFGQQLPITCHKDYNMIELWDDRAVQVVRNTGERVDGSE